MKRQPKGILRLALDGFGLRSPYVQCHLPPVPTWPHDPEQILHLCLGGRSTVPQVKRLAERYQTTNAHLLKACSLMREEMHGGETLTFEEVRTVLTNAYMRYCQEYTLRQNANRGAGTFPTLTSEPTWHNPNPRPAPTREQSEEWRLEEHRIREDITGRRWNPNMVVKEKQAGPSKAILDLGLDF